MGFYVIAKKYWRYRAFLVQASPISSRAAKITSTNPRYINLYPVPTNTESIINVFITINKNYNKVTNYHYLDNLFFIFFIILWNKLLDSTKLAVTFLYLVWPEYNYTLCDRGWCIWPNMEHSRKGTLHKLVKFSFTENTHAWELPFEHFVD